MRSRLALVLAFCAVSVCLPAQPALAAPPLRPPVDGTHVLLAFGASYGADASVHRGIDIAAPSGSPVRAPISGTVTFAGRLPSGEGGAAGVTITAADGTKVTCSPLADVAVAKGETVEAAAPLGTVSAEGDPSSQASHVHLSVREGDLYLDPAPLLVAPPSEPEPQPDPQPSASPAPAGAAAALPAAAEAAAASALPAAVSAGTADPAPAGLGSPRSDAAAIPVATLVPHVAAGLHRPAWRVPLRQAVPSPAALPDVGPVASRLRSLTLTLGAAMVAAALLVPILRKRPFEAPAEAAQVRAEA